MTPLPILKQRLTESMNALEHPTPCLRPSSSLGDEGHAVDHSDIVTVSKNVGVEFHDRRLVIVRRGLWSADTSGL